MEFYKIKKFQIVLFALIFVSLVTSGCYYSNACSRGRRTLTSQQQTHYCDVRINVIVRLPLSYYYGDYGYITVEGPNGFLKDITVPMMMGNQVITLHAVPEGRYTFTLKYAGMVTSKCAVVCCYCDADWKAQCTYNLKEVLKRKYRGEFGTQEDWAYSSPACGYPEPCQVVVNFVIPDDPYKYDF